MKPALLIIFQLILHLSPRFLCAQPVVRDDFPAYASIDTQLRAADSVVNDDSAIVLYEKSMTQSKSAGYNIGTIKAISGIAARYQNKDDNQNSILYLDRAISIARSSKTLFNQLPHLYVSKGRCYQFTGNYDSSISSYYEAITLQGKYGSTISTAIPYINLGLVFRRLGRYDLAITNFKTALPIAKKESQSKLLSGIYLNLGGVYTALKMPDSFGLAEKYLNESLLIARTYHYPLLEHKVLYELGVLCDNRGMPLKAIDYYEAAHKIPTGKRYDDLIPVISLGSSYYKQARYDKAQKILEPGLQQALTMTPPPEYLSDFYLQLAQVYQAEGSYRKSAEYFNRYIELSEKLRGVELNKRVDQLQLQYETVKRDNQLIKNELLITKQQAIIERKNTVTYLILLAVAIISVLVWLYYRSRRKMEKQKEEKAIWNATMRGEEKERARIARELHDHIGGSLSNAKMWFSTIQKDYPVLQHGPDFKGALELLDNTLTEVRDTAHSLMPELVLRHGLAEAVRIHCENVQRASGIKIKYHYLGYLGGVDKNLELILYRTIQELLQNVVKHADASFVLVQLSCHDQVFSLTVEDNGKGIDVTHKDHPGNSGMGLKNIQSAVANLNGEFSIRSAPESGTSVCFEINLKKQALKN